MANDMVSQPRMAAVVVIRYPFNPMADDTPPAVALYDVKVTMTHLGTATLETEHEELTLPVQWLEIIWRSKDYDEFKASQEGEESKKKKLFTLHKTDESNNQED